MNRILINSLLNATKRNPSSSSMEQKRNLFFYGPNRVFEMMKEQNHAREHGVPMWRKLTYFVALPAVAVFSVYIYFVEQEHAKHPRQPFVEYEYLYHRKKDFPWKDGKRSLFHNPEKNALPGTGYEVPDPNEGHGHGHIGGSEKH